MRVLIGAVAACLAADVAAAQIAGRVVSGEGNWQLKAAADGPAVGASCVLTPKTQSRIVIGKDRLDVTGLPKNSLFNYQYRVDDDPASTPSIPSAAMQDAGVVSLSGKDFEAVLNGRRFRIRMLDKWHEAITEDVDLTGLRDLHRRMLDECR